jgi:hypothetical protein
VGTNAGGPKVFTDEDEKVGKVPGKWRLASGLDMRQASDYSVPVIVRGINTSSGQGKYAGRVKITEAELENRVQKTTRSIQLRWAIVMHRSLTLSCWKVLCPLWRCESKLIARLCVWTSHTFTLTR